MGVRCLLPLLGVLACTRTPAPPAATLDFSAPEGSAEPSLSAVPTGGLLATWFEPRGSGRFALRIATRREEGWSVPVTVVERGDFFVNWADFPSAVETSDGAWVVHWLQKTATKSYAYHIRMAVSHDRGSSWSDPVSPHSDSSATEHGFVAMLARPSGGADLVWLDGRGAGGQSGGGAEGHRGGMALALGAIDELGRVSPDTILDSKTCDCCQTALARTALGLIAVYRDRSDSEIRDIAISRLLNGRWSSPVPVAEDGWVYRACPVNGPAVAASDRLVVVGWYTAASDTPRVQLAQSSDAGAGFAAPLRVDDGSPLGRVQVALLPDSSIVALWLEKAGDQAEWRAKQYSWDGRMEGRWTLGAAPATRSAGFARAALQGKTLYVAWTARGAGGGVRIHRLTPP
jgi:hypothetical protein